MNMHKVVIIGSGNVATVLGGTIAAAGHSMLQVAGLTEGPAAQLAADLRCGYTTDWTAIDRTADIYLVALSDTA